MSDEMKPWQRGYPLASLRRIKQVFDAYDKGMCYGAFTKVKENLVADWLHKATLITSANTMVVATVDNKDRKRKGFGAYAYTTNVGAYRIKRVACFPGTETDLVNHIRSIIGDGEAWLETWVEHPTTRYICESLGFRWVTSNVLAASEIVGHYYRGPRMYPGPLYIDQVTLQRLQLLAFDVTQTLTEINGLPYADHYSSYNVKKSWSAMALRGFGGMSDFIIKPSEMSKKWKEDNAPKLSWGCCDTHARELLPSLEPLINAVPGKKERIRLMRLSPGGGELLRHADITDPDAGTQDGELMRIHIPLLTNPLVVFTQWDLIGRKLTAHMRPGEVWYLDTRKPHTAVNAGSTERIHLVMDVFANPQLRALLEPELC